MDTTPKTAPHDLSQSYILPNPTVAAVVPASELQKPGLPLEIVATAPYEDTDFRRKLGIERWGWGLND